MLQSQAVYEFVASEQAVTGPYRTVFFSEQTSGLTKLRLEVMLVSRSIAVGWGADLDILMELRSFTFPE